MAVQGKALYNLLRMNWLRDPKMDVEQWQVEEYRDLTDQALFNRLDALDLPMDKQIFLAYAETCETPEELAEQYADEEHTPKEQDQIYLLLFELWRRFLPESLCLSIFCDELDHQIYQYDSEESDDAEEIQDAIENLRELVEDNVDEGADPVETFGQISEACANDLESFLYDYILEQIEEENSDYAAELVEEFSEYVDDDRWFLLLNARVVAHNNPVEGNDLVRELFHRSQDEDPSLELNLEILAFLIQAGEPALFAEVVEGTLHQIDREDDFQDLLQLVVDYFSCLDREEDEQKVQALLDSRHRPRMEKELDRNDPDRKLLLSVFE